MKKPLLILSIVILIFVIFYTGYCKFIILYFESFSKFLFPENPNRNGELFKIVLTVIGGTGILYSLFLSYKRMIATNRGLALQGEAINKQSEQLELSRNGQVDERFKNAVEHLGSEKEPIILGGIVELHQIAKVDRNKYSAVVFNILTSYLRSTLKVQKKRDDQFSPTIAQTIIDFLFKNEGCILYENLQADLSFCNLLSLEISNSSFKGANLGFSLMPHEIENVNFENAKFGRTSFSISKLKMVNFSKAEFYDCIFNLCDLRDVDFSDVDAKIVIFTNTKFFDVRFDKAELYDNIFLMCHFENLQIRASNIHNSKFWCSNFVDSHFTGCEITGTDFLGSGFSSTLMANDFSKCNFSGIRYSYDFEIITLEDVKSNIGAELNKSGLVELDENSFLRCEFKKFSEADYLRIEKEDETIVGNWERKYDLIAKDKKDVIK